MILTFYHIKAIYIALFYVRTPRFYLLFHKNTDRSSSCSYPKLFLRICGKISFNVLTISLRWPSLYAYELARRAYNVFQLSEAPLFPPKIDAETPLWAYSFFRLSEAPQNQKKKGVSMK